MNCVILPKSAFFYLTDQVDSKSALSLAVADKSDALVTPQKAVISDKGQISHIIEVLKLGCGDSLKVGMMGGYLGTAVIDTILPQQIKLTDVTLTVPPPPKLGLSVVLAVPRPKVLRRLIMDMTALGVDQIILVNSYRSQKSYWQSPMLKRLDEFVLEGLQQACDTIAPSIALRPRLKPFIEDELSGHLQGQAGLVAHPYSPLSLSHYLQSLQSSSQNTDPHHHSQSVKTRSLSLPKLLCVGAEGGWIDYEIDLFEKNGCQSVSVGARILRTEAAVNALIGQWLIHQG